MKWKFLSSLLFFSFTNSIAATVSWDGGGGDGLWSTGLNWTGDIMPGTGDNVILDNSFVAGSYTVILPAGMVTASVSTIIITPSGSNAILLLLPVTNTGDPGFIVTGLADAFVLNNGGKFQNSSGAATGSGLAITNTFRINNGGRYIHNTNRGNAVIVSQLSSAPGTETGEFEYDIPAVSTPISLSGRTYGTLILSSVANAGSVTYIGTGASPLHINGDLRINSGVTFSISMSADFIIHGGLAQSSTAVFNLQNSTNNNFVRIKGNVSIQGILTETNTGLPKLEFNGISNQDITVTGSLVNNIEIIINNPAGVSLLSPLVIPYHLQLVTGKLRTTPANLLTMADNAICTGGSTGSFIEGPMKKIGDDNFIFPVGEGGIFAPVGISNNAGETANDAFTAQYFRLNPQVIYGSNYESPINHISYVEHWRLERNTGSASKFVSLAVNEVSFATTDSALRVARLEGGLWKDAGQSGFIAGPVISPYITGTLISFPVSNFSSTVGPFAIASTIPLPDNPLPLKFLTFTAEKKNNNVLLKWKLAALPPVNSVFEIEHSPDGQNFIKIGSIASGPDSLYDYEVPVSSNNISCYRIKINDIDGSIILSPTVTVLNNPIDIKSIQVFPNPVKDRAIIKLTAEKAGRVRIRILDISLKLTGRADFHLFSGSNTITLDLALFPKGVYILHIEADESRINQIILIKEQ